MLATFSYFLRYVFFNCWKVFFTQKFFNHSKLKISVNAVTAQTYVQTYSHVWTRCRSLSIQEPLSFTPSLSQSNLATQELFRSIYNEKTLNPKQIATKGFSMIFIPTGYTDQQKKCLAKSDIPNWLKLSHFQDGRHRALKNRNSYNFFNNCDRNIIVGCGPWF